MHKKDLKSYIKGVKTCENAKTRRGSPSDDRPSTDKLHNFVWKKMKKKKEKKMWHVTCDT